MLLRLLGAIVFSIFVTAIARGIVMALSLDATVAGVINVASNPDNLSTISWVISGSIGLILLLFWLLFRVDEKLYDHLLPHPGLGTLIFEGPFEAHISKHNASGRVDVEMVLKIKNTNSHLVKAVGEISGEANGKATSAIPIDMYVPANTPGSLVLRVFDIPMTAYSFGTPSVTGIFVYRLRYAFPPKLERIEI